MDTERPDETVKDAGSLPLELKSLLIDHQQWLCGVLDLAAMETRRAGLSMALILGLGGLLIVAASSVWILACASAVAAAVAAGASWTVSLLTATVLNALLMGGILFAIVRLSRNLAFAASRAVLRPRGAPGADPVAGVNVHCNAQAA